MTYRRGVDVGAFTHLLLFNQDASQPDIFFYFNKLWLLIDFEEFW